ncbi:MAG: hypothetical protein BWY96_00868 [Spirochaetes bacterium ADurb.BinA120]|nr:MAG: hypothetical protein BWY96_00868 [Spirochaetes bacterium ADurb.BinA120]
MGREKLARAIYDILKHKKTQHHPENRYIARCYAPPEAPGKEYRHGEYGANGHQFNKYIGKREIFGSGSGKKNSRSGQVGEEHYPRKGSIHTSIIVHQYTAEDLCLLQSYPFLPPAGKKSHDLLPSGFRGGRRRLRIERAAVVATISCHNNILFIICIAKFI